LINCFLKRNILFYFKLEYLLSVDQKKKKFHFIAIGSSATDNLAAALKQLGHTITTADEALDKSVDGVIIGEQTNRSNPVLLKAQQLGLKIYTVPEFIYEFAKNKQRIVIVGTSGRTEIASMILHVLKSMDREVDYVLSDDRANSISLSDAPVIVIDGSASRASAVYHTPQFIRYKHHVGIMSEVEYDPQSSLSENDFIRQFDLFADGTPKGGILIYLEQDKIASLITNKERGDVLYVPYKAHPKDKLPAPLTDKKLLLSVSAAFEALKRVGVTSEQFYKAIASYQGA
jgi:UDP-N-acetylmuramate: L-alanyl-gamma-D-glutamyl-meso-diaminopimelate ligase